MPAMAHVKSVLQSLVFFYEPLDPGKWIPPLNTRVLKEGAIEVKIGHSPSRFNFTQFKVMLIKGTSFEKSAFKTIFYTEPVSLTVGML